MFTKEKAKPITLGLSGLCLVNDRGKISLYEDENQISVFENYSWNEAVDWVRKNLKNVQLLKKEF